MAATTSYPIGFGEYILEWKPSKFVPLKDEGFRLWFLVDHAIDSKSPRPKDLLPHEERFIDRMRELHAMGALKHISMEHIERAWANLRANPPTAGESASAGGSSPNDGSPQNGRVANNDLPNATPQKVAPPAFSSVRVPVTPDGSQTEGTRAPNASQMEPAGALVERSNSGSQRKGKGARRVLKENKHKYYGFQEQKQYDDFLRWFKRAMDAWIPTLKNRPDAQTVMKHFTSVLNRGLSPCLNGSKDTDIMRWGELIKNFYNSTRRRIKKQKKEASARATEAYNAALNEAAGEENNGMGEESDDEDDEDDLLHPHDHGDAVDMLNRAQARSVQRAANPAAVAAPSVVTSTLVGDVEESAAVPEPMQDDAPEPMQDDAPRPPPLGMTTDVSEIVHDDIDFSFEPAATMQYTLTSAATVIIPHLPQVPRDDRPASGWVGGAINKRPREIDGMDEKFFSPKHKVQKYENTPDVAVARHLQRQREDKLRLNSLAQQRVENLNASKVQAAKDKVEEKKAQKDLEKKEKDKKREEDRVQRAADKVADKEKKRREDLALKEKIALEKNQQKLNLDKEKEEMAARIAELEAFKAEVTASQKANKKAPARGRKMSSKKGAKTSSAAASDDSEVAVEEEEEEKSDEEAARSDDSDDQTRSRKTKTRHARKPQRYFE